MENTKSCIRNSIIRLMHDTDFLNITVRMVTEDSGISRSTFYRYYDSIDSVITELEDEILDSISFINTVSLSDRNNISSIESTFSRLARSSILKEHADFIRVVNGPHGDIRYKDRCMKLIRKYLSEVMKRDGSYSEEMEFFIEFMAGGFFHVINYWIIERPDVSAEEFERIQQITFRMFMQYYGMIDQ